MPLSSTACHQQRLKTTPGGSSYSIPEKFVTEGKASVWKVNTDIRVQRK